MAKTYRPYLPEQDFLLPPSLGEWLPEKHLAYFVSGVANQPFSRPEQLVATDRLTQVRLLSADVRLAIDGRPAYDAPRRHRDFCPVWPR